MITINYLNYYIYFFLNHIVKKVEVGLKNKRYIDSLKKYIFLKKKKNKL
jgi:hypothetical protein